MARTVRIALDLALGSFCYTRPIVIKVWRGIKGKIMDTKAKTIVENTLVQKLETSLDGMSLSIATKIESWRDNQLCDELKYLQSEIAKVQQKIENAKAKFGTKVLRNEIVFSWRYLKVECAPPMTLALLHGPIGKKIEESASSVGDGFIKMIDSQIKAIDLAEERQRLEKEAAIAAALKKAKEDEQKKKLEAAKKALQAKEKAAAEKAAEAEKKDAGKKKKDEPKAKKDEPKAKKDEPKAKKDEPKARKDDKNIKKDKKKPGK